MTKRWYNQFMVTVVLIDDHPVVRAGIRTILDAAEDVIVAGEGSSGADALRLTEQHRPDVLVLDVNLPDLNGLEVVRQLRARQARTAILILTAHADPSLVMGLLEGGAMGYVLKDEALETLLSAVRAVAAGQSWLSPPIARQVVQRAAGRPASFPLDELTPRELDVLRLLAQGLDNAAIARRLVVTTRTVQNHVSVIYNKLGVSSRTEAALCAIRCGLTTVGPPDDDRGRPR